jgi:NAD(P)-dependent dehydrogenase (short-subunit alcohol dehydrogenase family)
MTGPGLLEGRVAVVTGGGRGVGLAIARALHAAGAAVVVADDGAAIDGDRPDPAVAQDVAGALGEGALAFTRDLSEDGAPAAAVEVATDAFGAVDLVVNNAAILRDALIFRARQDDWERVLRVNLHVPVALLAAATPRMRDQVKAGRKPGRIVNIVSTAGLIGNFGQSAYAAAKAGLLGLTRVVAMEMARSGITCNAVAPFAATRVTDSIQPANDAQAQYKARALRVPAEYVARLVGFLCASENTFTGQVLGVRGREVFLFSQTRPVVRVVAEPLDRQDALALGGALEPEFADHLVDLATDLELFNTEPMV